MITRRWSQRTCTAGPDRVIEPHRPGDPRPHLAALRSAVAWRLGPAGRLAADPTAKVAADATRALTRAQVAALWLEAGVREKALWRLLYETAARAEEILTLDIGDLDTASKRTRVVSKGGAAPGREPRRPRPSRQRAGAGRDLAAGVVPAPVEP
jgi:integrase